MLRRVSRGCFAAEVADVSGRCFAAEAVGISSRCFAAEVAGFGWTDALPSVALADALPLLSLRLLSLLATLVWKLCFRFGLLGLLGGESPAPHFGVEDFVDNPWITRESFCLNYV